MTVVTLLTDFGTTDSYVAEVKGVLLTRAPTATLVDISHGVPPGDVRSAAYIVGRTWHRFPEGTVHLVVIDPGVGTARAALALHARNHFFVGPDNGVFTPVLPDTAVEIIALPTPSAASPTFHGRDLFAPAAADLAAGASLSSLGTFFPGIPQRLAVMEPHVEGRAIVGEVVYVDRFGTLITNLTSELVPFSAKIEVEDLDLGGLKRTFSDVGTGGLLAFVGSGGAIEIAVRDGSAASRLGIGIGARVRATVE
jgi:S-adenosyl-L-methionine hydrolase (adenosine-forming)